MSKSALQSTTDTKVQSAVSTMDTAAVNTAVWAPWWRVHLEQCGRLIEAVKDRDYEKTAILINVEYLQDQAVNVNY